MVSDLQRLRKFNEAIRKGLKYILRVPSAGNRMRAGVNAFCLLIGREKSDREAFSQS